MSDRVWTESQRDAILAQNGTLLVSAAAGSGKTAVLVERVIKRLTDPKNPCDADKLLIVTFTNAAAAEMKERIYNKISELLEEDPENNMLQRQQILLNNANISTIHSFCNNIIRENFYRLNISQDFRIADTNEITILKEEAIEEVLEEFYRQDNPEFLEMSEFFSSGKDDRKLVYVIEKLYEFVRSSPFSDTWFENIESLYNIEPNTNVADTVWGKVIVEYIKDAINYCITVTKNSLEIIKEDENILKAYIDAFNSDLAGLTFLKDIVDTNTWDNIYTNLKMFSFEKLKSLRGYKEDLIKIKAYSNRNQVKDTISKLCKLVSLDNSDCLDNINKIKPIVNCLFKVLKKFSEKLDELKLKKNIADFGDLEQWMLKLLVVQDKDSFKVTEQAIEISNRFVEIMVDEYQDTNKVQDMIFRAISKNEENLFFVGDVKQSIYGFRQAMPEIFLGLKNSFDKYDKNKDLYPSKIILDKNFRSRKGITDAINFVFSQLMSERVGQLDYTDEEKLVYGASYEDRDIKDVSLHIIDLANDSKKETCIVEARHISEIISEMICSGHKIKDGDITRPVTYKDFCILLRSANKYAYTYANELNLSGIPAWSDTAGSFFGTLEVSVILSLLKIIDNPLQDIAILSVLVSPIFGFTPEELTDLRLENKETPLYFCIKSLAKKGNLKCIDFIDNIDEYRRLSVTMPTYKLLNYIYEKTSYLSIVQAMKNGKLRLANLRLLLEYSRKYELSGYKGLAGFIRFIDKLEENKSDLKPACTISESANVVRIMSIHRSKGLEFPVCILAGCSRKFNNDNDNIMINPKLGIGMNLRDNSGLVQYTTMPKEAILLESERICMSEELRVLYVAMTRAKENLIMITSLNDSTKTLNKLAAQLTDSHKIPEYLVKNSKSFSDWLLYCALRHPSGNNLRKISGADPEIVVTDSNSWNIKLISCDEKDTVKIENKESNIKGNIDNNLIDIINKRINFNYFKEGLNNVPSKVAVSELSNAYDLEEQYNVMKRPSFAMKTNMNNAERGTALHAFMQFADYKEAFNNLEKHIDYLVTNNFITKEQSNALDKNKIRKFLSGSLMKRMLSSEKIMREFKFSVNIEAKKVKMDLEENLKNEVIILQGSVDCAFFEDNQIVIVDYKTDHVKDMQQLKKMYSLQLNLYKYALEKCFDAKVKETIIYSFELDNSITI